MAWCRKSQKSPHNCCSGLITSQAAPVTQPYKQALHTRWWILENRIIYCHIQLDTEHKAADPFPHFIMSKPELRYKDVKCIFTFPPSTAAPSARCIAANDNVPRIYCTFDTPVTKLYFSCWGSLLYKSHREHIRTACLCCTAPKGQRVVKVRVHYRHINYC